MSDLANLVLAGIRDKVVLDLKEENDQLSAKNAVLSKAMLLEAPSFGRVEIQPRLVAARTQQFPDPRPRCDCCAWYPMTMERVVAIGNLPEIDLELGLAPDQPLVKLAGKAFRVTQVTGYATETQCTAIQIAETSLSATLHLAVGPIQRDAAKALFANTPRDLTTFCLRFMEVAPEATVEIVCLSISNSKAVDLLTSKARLSEEEARTYLRIPIAENSNAAGEGDEAKDA
jgi:hypothetical protein